MGRSSGGGSHSSGGFSGGHSSGGFSGGGRSSGRSHSSSSYSGGGSHGPYYGGYRPRPPRIHYSWGPRTYVYSSGSHFFIYIIIIILIFIAISFMQTSYRKNNDYKITESTKQRQALNGVVNKTDWYNDKIGWITNKNKLISGLEQFYNETGIQPYVIFIPYSEEYWNGTNFNATKADAYLEQVYANTFTDEGHFIFAYFECLNDSKAEMEGEFRYLSGYTADTIMDSEAINILWGYFEKNYYNTSLSIEEMISTTFKETSKAIMSKPTNVWDFAKVLISVVGIVLAISIIYLIIQNKNKREKEKEEYTKEILSKPLETFGNDTSDIEEKYK